MHSFNRLVLTALFLFNSVHDTIGISCYLCGGDSGCNDPFNKGYNSNRTISSRDGWCWKGKGELNGNQVVLRGGGAVIEGSGSPSIGCVENKCMKGTILNVTGDFCCCNTNLCNGAERIALTVSILFTIPFFIIRY